MKSSENPKYHQIPNSAIKKMERPTRMVVRVRSCMRVVFYSIVHAHKKPQKNISTWASGSASEVHRTLVALKPLHLSAAECGRTGIRGVEKGRGDGRDERERYRIARA